MNSQILKYREQLLDICEKKLKLLQSVSEHFAHIESNTIFVEEIHETYLEFEKAESDLIAEKNKTIDCPGCGFECDQIHSFCMACGTNLHEQYKVTTV